MWMSSQSPFSYSPSVFNSTGEYIIVDVAWFGVKSSHVYSESVDRLKIYCRVSSESLGIL